MSEKTVGKIIRAERLKRDWTVKTFREQILSRIKGTVSPAYITRIEQYDEIPSPELLCVIADIFGYDVEQLLGLAKEAKVRRFDENLEKKYQEAAGLFRTRKESGE